MPSDMEKCVEVRKLQGLGDIEPMRTTSDNAFELSVETDIRSQIFEYGQNEAAQWLASKNEEMKDPFLAWSRDVCVIAGHACGRCCI